MTSSTARESEASPSSRPTTPQSIATANSDSNWASEAGAVLRKDLRVEWRTRHGVYTAMLFAVMTVVALALATANTKPEPDIQAGFLWVALIFAAITSLARGFISEEEQGTADLLRLAGRPSSVLAGKMLFHWVLLLVTEMVMIPLSMLMLSIHVSNWMLFVAHLVAGSIGLAACVTICGALVARASSRGALVGVLAFPILVPLIAMAVGAAKASLGTADPGVGWSAVLGILGWTVSIGAAGFWLFEHVWRE